jgi:hypothetical protein
LFRFTSVTNHSTSYHRFRRPYCGMISYRETPWIVLFLKRIKHGGKVGRGTVPTKLRKHPRLVQHQVSDMARILAVLHSFVRVYAGEMSHAEESHVREPEEGSERETETCNHFPESELHKACCHRQVTCSSEPDQQWSERMLSNDLDVLWLQHEDSTSKRYSSTYIYRSGSPFLRR